MDGMRPLNGEGTVFWRFHFPKHLIGSGITDDEVLLEGKGEHARDQNDQKQEGEKADSTPPFP